MDRLASVKRTDREQRQWLLRPLNVITKAMHITKAPHDGKSDLNPIYIVCSSLSQNEVMDALRRLGLISLND